MSLIGQGPSHNDPTFTGDVDRNVEKGDGQTINGDFGWEDITSEITVRGVGGTNPPWAQVGAGPFRAYNFGVNDECWMAFHIPHDIVPSSDLFLHTHWFGDGTNTNIVKWQYTYTYAKGFVQEAFDPTGTVITAEEAANATAYQHQITETAAITIPTLTEPDGLVYVHIKRVTNGGTDNTDNIFVLTSDIHYQSTGIKTMNKAPDFYV